MAGARRWRVVGASVRGTGHEKTGQPCQDFASWEVLSDETLLMAVADGAGTACCGQIGAEAGVRAAMEAVRKGIATGEHRPASGEQPSAQPEGVACPPLAGQQTAGNVSLGQAVAERWRQVLTQAFHAARFALEEEAQRRSLSLRDLATTLIVVLADNTHVGVAQVGDGAVVVATGEGELSALSLPPPSEYLNETVFLVSPDWSSWLQLRVWQGQAAGLAAFSDGLEMLALRMPSGIPHAPFFVPLFRFLCEMSDAREATTELTRFLGSAGVRQRTDDDVTLVLAVPVG